MTERLASPQRMAALYALATSADPLISADICENIAEYFAIDEHPEWLPWLRACVRDMLASWPDARAWSLSAAQIATLEHLLLEHVRHVVADEAYDAWTTEGRRLLKRATHG